MATRTHIEVVMSQFSEICSSKRKKKSKKSFSCMMLRGLYSMTSMMDLQGSCIKKSGEIYLYEITLEELKNRVWIHIFSFVAV
jgi:hypothetical protein